MFLRKSLIIRFFENHKFFFRFFFYYVEVTRVAPPALQTGHRGGHIRGGYGGHGGGVSGASRAWVFNLSIPIMNTDTRENMTVLNRL